MAASKPTSWLSVPSHIVSHLTMVLRHLRVGEVEIAVQHLRQHPAQAVGRDRVGDAAAVGIHILAAVVVPGGVAVIGLAVKHHQIPGMSSFSDRAHWADGICELCLYMQANKKFYINALSTPGQNSFEEYFTQFLQGLVTALIDESAVGGRLSAEDKEFIADFYSFAFVGLVMKWARGGMREDPHHYVDHIKDLVDGSMMRELDKYR